MADPTKIEELIAKLGQPEALNVALNALKPEELIVQLQELVEMEKQAKKAQVSSPKKGKRTPEEIQKQKEESESQKQQLENLAQVKTKLIMNLINVLPSEEVEKIEEITLEDLGKVEKAQRAVLNNVRDNKLAEAESEEKKRTILKGNQQKIDSLKISIDNKLNELTTEKKPDEEVGLSFETEFKGSSPPPPPIPQTKIQVGTPPQQKVEKPKSTEPPQTFAEELKARQPLKKVELRQEAPPVLKSEKVVIDEDEDWSTEDVQDVVDPNAAKGVKEMLAKLVSDPRRPKIETIKGLQKTTARIQTDLERKLKVVNDLPSLPVEYKKPELGYDAYEKDQMALIQKLEQTNNQVENLLSTHQSAIEQTKKAKEDKDRKPEMVFEEEEVKETLLQPPQEVNINMQSNTDIPPPPPPPPKNTPVPPPNITGELGAQNPKTIKEQLEEKAKEKELNASTTITVEQTQAPKTEAKTQAQGKENQSNLMGVLVSAMGKRRKDLKEKAKQPTVETVKVVETPKLPLQQEKSYLTEVATRLETARKKVEVEKTEAQKLTKEAKEHTDNLKPIVVKREKPVSEVQPPVIGVTGIDKGIEKPVVVVTDKPVEEKKEETLKTDKKPEEKIAETTMSKTRERAPTITSPLPDPEQPYVPENDEIEELTDYSKTDKRNDLPIHFEKKEEAKVTPQPSTEKKPPPPPNKPEKTGTATTQEAEKPVEEKKEEALKTDKKPKEKLAETEMPKTKVTFMPEVEQKLKQVQLEQAEKVYNLITNQYKESRKNFIKLFFPRKETRKVQLEKLRIDIKSIYNDDNITDKKAELKKIFDALKDSIGEEKNKAKSDLVKALDIVIDKIPPLEGTIKEKQGTTLKKK